MHHSGSVPKVWDVVKHNPLCLFVFRALVSFSIVSFRSAVVFFFRLIRIRIGKQVVDPDSA